MGRYRNEGVKPVISIGPPMKRLNKPVFAVLAAAWMLAAPASSPAAEPEAPMVSAYWGSGSVTFFYGGEGGCSPGCEREGGTRYGLDPRPAANGAYWDGHHECALSPLAHAC